MQRTDQLRGKATVFQVLALPAIPAQINAMCGSSGLAARADAARFQPAMTWDRKLARTLTLGDGRSIGTLRSAAELLIARFDGVTHWAALEHARNLLIIAAKTGKRRDVAAATDQLVIVLSQRGLMR